MDLEILVDDLNYVLAKSNNICSDPDILLNVFVGTDLRRWQDYYSDTSYFRGLNNIVEDFNFIFEDYKKKFNLDLGLVFREWRYDYFFGREIVKRFYDGEISKEKRVEIMNCYNSIDCEFTQKLHDLKMLYFVEQSTIQIPTVFCGLLGYDSVLDADCSYQGMAFLENPFMVMNFHASKWNRLFKHELNHCFGATHSKIPFTLMYPRTDRQSDFLLPGRKKEIKKVLEEKYKEPFKYELKI